MKLIVKRIERSTKDSVTLVFDRIPEFDHYKAGQHVSLSTHVYGNHVSRTYSINSSPNADQEIAITIRSIPGGSLSNYVIENIREKELVELDGPFGDFTVEPSLENKRNLILFAGGSGITPVISILKSVLHGEPLSCVSLIYSNRSEERIIFKSELQEFQRTYKDRFHLLHVISQPQEIDSDLTIFYKGQLSKLIVRKLIRNLLNENSMIPEVYLCGPYGFMQMIEAAVISLNLDLSIHKENFFIPPNQLEPSFDFTSLVTREIRIQWREQEYLLNVPGGQSILTAALNSDLKLPHSCQGGQCGTCRSVLIAGEVKLRKNHILTEEELQQSQILTCQAYPISEGVTIQQLY